ncbi:hypothetical protein HX99_06950 [Peptococcaceae bacterium SCADC1_2_3]|jgi:hypothetical protein|nr:hypothetical protein DK28_0212115 [Peptococcaceae bacterium SCADC1_2_3]KFI35010.1 hypothetical protein HX99_06950 [Peptococcaceae bacterium SCADC1_2_3]KFI37492.1 hypothetical protein HY02_06215 [Peptococcaceae bacterium SCADC1_2_3]
MVNANFSFTTIILVVKLKEQKKKYEISLEELKQTINQEKEHPLYFWGQSGWFRSGKAIRQWKVTKI